MNRADQDVLEFFDAGTDFLDNDEVPETLLAVLKVIAEDFVPETRAAALCINSWLTENQPHSGTAATTRLGGSPGNAQFKVRGQSVSAIAQPYRFYLLQRVQALYNEFSAQDKTAVEDMLASCDMSEILTIKLDRKLERKGNLEVWL